MRRGAEGGASHHGECMDTEPVLQGFLKGEQHHAAVLCSSWGLPVDGGQSMGVYCLVRGDPGSGSSAGGISQAKAAP